MLAAGLTLLALGIAARLSSSLLVLAGTNSVVPEARVAVSRRGHVSFCQGGEVLPADTSAVRLGMVVNIGPMVTVTARSGSLIVARGTRSAGWTGAVVTVPIGRVPHTVSHMTLCIAIARSVEPIELTGGVAPAPAGREPSAKVAVEYLRPGTRSWWSSAVSIAERLGLGRAPRGRWVALIPIALMVAATLLTSWLVLTQLGWGSPASPPRAPRRPSTRGTRAPRRGPALGAVLRRVPRVAWACAGVACLSAASWSIVIPPFQAPDEPSHFAYVQQLAEAGALPASGAGSFSPEELTALQDLHAKEVRYNPQRGTISTAAQERRLEYDLALPLSRQNGGAAGVASTEPPLYYALQTIPYYMGSGGSLLDRLALMRLLSALMAGITALFAFMFLREALPGAPWAWTVGALGVALFPLLGFISGVVNPDAMLCAVSAALFYCLARAFRRGLSPRLAVAIGAVVAVGFLTKLNFLGLVPGLALALVLLTRRAARSAGRSAYRSPAIAIGIAASPVGLYALVNAISHHPALGQASVGIDLAGAHGSLLSELSYIWQLYLPRLPGMTNDFPGVLTSRLWFDRSVGLYGWLDTMFPGWVYKVALIPAALIAALCARELIVGRASLRRRLGELLVYATMGVGVAALVGANSFLLFPRRAGGYFEPRYMLPLVVLLGAVLALAARGAGRRWGPAVGALIVVLLLGHDIFSQLLVVSRYYG